jgi:hypothetical protein
MLQTIEVMVEPSKRGSGEAVNFCIKILLSRNTGVQLKKLTSILNRSVMCGNKLQTSLS